MNTLADVVKKINESGEQFTAEDITNVVAKVDQQLDELGYHQVIADIVDSYYVNKKLSTSQGSLF